MVSGRGVLRQWISSGLREGVASFWWRVQTLLSMALLLRGPQLNVLIILWQTEGMLKDTEALVSHSSWAPEWLLALGRQLLQVKTSHVKSSNTAHYSGLCPQIPGFSVALGPDSPPPHSKSGAIPTSLHIVIVSLGALKYWGRHIFKCQAPRWWRNRTGRPLSLL